MPNKVIGICGLIGSGKDTVGDTLVREFGYTRMSFAMVLKDMLAVVFNWDRELLDGKTPASRLWRDEEDEWWSAKLGKKWTPRIAMQQIGTDLFRKQFFEDMWVATVENKMRDHDKIVFTDVRFPNEIRFIKSAGELWTVERGANPEWVKYAVHYNTAINNELDDPTIKFDVHESEWAWIGLANSDQIVYNNNTLESLNQVVRNLVSDEVSDPA